MDIVYLIKKIIKEIVLINFIKYALCIDTKQNEPIKIIMVN